MLTGAGLSPKVMATGTGLWCDIGSGEGPVIALRAELDALPIQDAKTVSYRSRNDGVCHACGHDVHTAVITGVGLALASIATHLPGTVRLLFQPAEEMVPGGAPDVVAEGVLDGVTQIFALHCDPKVPTGQVGVRSGPITAASDMLRIEVAGPGGHTARPPLTADVGFAVARIVTELPAMLSRLVDPRAAMTVSFGSIHAGTAGNAIAASGSCTGTVRVLDRDAWDEAPRLIEHVVDSIVSPLKATFTLDYQRGSPPVVNPPRATQLFTDAARATIGYANVVPTAQSLGGEDFSWYLEHAQGCFARLGVGRPDLDLHTATFDVNEEAIGVGVRVLTAVTLAALHAER
jgi:amidohydrolase